MGCPGRWQSHHLWMCWRKGWTWIQCQGLTGWCLVKGWTRPSQRPFPPWPFLWFCHAQMQSCPCPFFLLILPACLPPMFPPGTQPGEHRFTGPKGERADLCCRMPEPFPLLKARQVPEGPGFNGAALSSAAGACHVFSVLQNVKLGKSVAFDICPLRQYLISVPHQPKSWKW